jgi:hypothetical protein
MPHEEKRRATRVPVRLTAHCRIGHRIVRDSIADLSSSGLYLRTRAAAAEGTLVRVALALPFSEGPKVCTLVGAVARVDRDGRGLRQGLGVALSVVEMSAADLDALAGFLGSKAA